MTGEQSVRKGWKIGVLALVGVLIVAGGVGAATLPTWAEHSSNEHIAAAIESEARTPVHATPELLAPVIEDMNLSMVPANKAVEVNPATMASVAVEHGTVESVKLIPAAGGEPIAGEINAAGTAWTATERLAFNTSYTMEHTVSDGANRTSTEASTFATVAPANEANAWTYPLDGMTVGVGQPVQINFSEPVLNKAEVEAAIEITTSAGQAGAFHWYNDSMLRYRPKDFWEANSTITIDFSLFGVEFGNSMVGNHDSSVTVNIGADTHAVVDNKTKDMKVYVGGELVRTMPVTLGMKEWPSSSGIHVVMDQQRKADFNAGTIGLEPGDEHYYPPLTVEYASRISNSGEFVHSALKSALPYIGNTNVSHGCVGLAKKDAAWFFENFTTGDVVEIRHTDADELAPLDGFGDWNLSWDEWTK